MARSKILISQEVLLVGPSDPTGTHGSNLKELFRVQDISDEVSLQKENVLEAGRLAAVSREMNSPTEGTLSYSYYLVDLDNEYAFGFDTSGTAPALSLIFTGVGDERNYFKAIAPEGQSAIGLSGTDFDVVGYGQAVIDSYSIDASVGSFPKASVGLKFLNVRQYNDGVAQVIPAVNKITGEALTPTFTIPTITGGDSDKTSAIKYSDVIVDLSNLTGLFHEVFSGCVNSVKVDFSLNRTNQDCLGSKFSKYKTINPPIDINFSVDVVANDLLETNLTTLICNPVDYTAHVKLKNPTCATTTPTLGNGLLAVGLTLKGLSFEGYSRSSSVGGDSEIITLNFMTQMGGTGELDKGLFMSGQVFW